MRTGEDPVQADTTPSIPVIRAHFPTTRNLVLINFAVFVLCKLLNFFDIHSVFELGLEWGPATLRASGGACLPRCFFMSGGDTFWETCGGFG
jgi:hypothetical protein